MRKRLIDRWTDTAAFGAALIASAVLVLPVLGLGVLVSSGMVVFALAQRTASLDGAVFVALSVGGVLGIIGWVRAILAVKRPKARDVTATLVLLLVGIATAVAVGAIVVGRAVTAELTPWLPAAALSLPAIFVAANIVWILCGVGWMQRLTRHYAEHTGRAFDGLPVVLLVVAFMLALLAAGLSVTIAF